MGFFDAFTGKSSKNAAQQAAKAYDDGAAQAASTLDKSKADANRALTSGYEQSQVDIRDAQRRSWEALNGAGTAATNYYTDYGNKARDAVSGGMDRIRGYYNPMLQLGNQANDLYGRFLGLQGADAAKTAASQFAGNDPGIAYRMDMLGRQADRRANASGDIGGARAQMALDRSQSELLSNDYQNYLTRLENASARGGQYAGQLSGFEMQGAGQLANLYGQEGQNLAQNQIRHASALNAMLTGSPIGTGQLASNYYGNMADVAKGYGGQLAQLQTLRGQNQANMYTAMGAAGQQGVNNVMNALGTAAKAATLFV